MERNFPSDFGAIENNWRLLLSVINYSDGLTISELRAEVKKTNHAVHERGNNPDFLFFLGQGETIPTVLENMAHSGKLYCLDGKYRVTDSGKIALAKCEQEVAKYCGVGNLDEFLATVLNDSLS